MYSDSSNTAIRQPGVFYVTNLAGTPSGMEAGTVTLAPPSGKWSLITYGGNVFNTQPQSADGSLYVNDVYLRSAGRWASQMGGGGAQYASGGLYGYCMFSGFNFGGYGDSGFALPPALKPGNAALCGCPAGFTLVTLGACSLGGYTGTYACYKN